MSFSLALAAYGFAPTSVIEAKDLDPILEIKGVKPAGSVFNAATGIKPIVIKSQADAANYLGEEQLAVLDKSVDYKEQVVLLFAWKGSGGDKLSYTVAESFPEQVFFKLMPGRTRDYFEHSHVFVLRANVRWYLPGNKPGAESGDALATAVALVRPLRIEGASLTLAVTLGGQGKATALADAEAVQKLVGEAVVKSLTKSVDFQKEKIVLISWVTGGPPEGILRHEIKGTGKELTVRFYIQAPAAKVRGLRARLGIDFFAVPKEATVVFDPKEK